MRASRRSLALQSRAQHLEDLRGGMRRPFFMPMQPHCGIRHLSAVLIMLALAASLSVGVAGAQGEGPIYIVQPGDTLAAIALTFGTTVEALAEINGIEDPSTIYPGQELIIPGYPGISGVLSMRRIAYGETLTSTSMRHGLALETAARLNRVVNPARLVAGSRLVLPENAELPLALEQSSKATIPVGRGLLETSARGNSNPWRLQILNRNTDRLWLLPDELIYQPAQQGPTDALPPVLDHVLIEPILPVQGQTIVVEFQLSQPMEVEARLGPWDLNIFPTDEMDGIALQGIHALADPTLVDLELSFSDSQSGEPLEGYSQPLLILEGDYGFETLQVPSETVDPAVTGPEDELIGSVVANATPERYWAGVFQFPTDYYEAFPSLFGTRRSYNGSPFDYYHTGLDLYGSTSTPVMAPADGVIAFTDSLIVRGNVTYIDHGWGVFSGFLHQSQILVSVGDQVKAGEVIGYVGGTGRVTGPHLHWEIWVGGVPVNPIEWTVREMPEA